MKTPKQKWQIVYNIGGYLSESVGCTVYTTMKNYWYTYIAEVLVFTYFVLTLYTMWYYSREEEYFRGLQGTCSIGIVFVVNVFRVFLD